MSSNTILKGSKQVLAVSIAMELGLQSKAPFSGVAAVGLGALALRGHGRISYVSLPYHMPTRSNPNSPSEQPTLSCQALSCLAAVQLEQCGTLRPSCMPRKRLPRTGKAWPF